MPQRSGTTRKSTTRRAATAAAAVGMTAAGLAVAPPAHAATVTPTWRCAVSGQNVSGKAPIGAELLRSDATGASLRVDPGPLPGTPLVGDPDAVGRVTYVLDLSGSGFAGTTRTVTTASAPMPYQAGAPIDPPAQEVSFDLPVTLPATVSVTVRSLTLSLGGFDIGCAPTSGNAPIATYQLVAPAPSLSVGADEVVAGETVTVSGSGWPAGTTPRACLAPVPGGACDPALLGARPLAVSADGRLTGGVVVGAGTPPGAYLLWIRAGETSAAVPLTVRAAPRSGPEVTVSAASGPVGTTVTLRGQGFRSGVDVRIRPTRAGGTLPGEIRVSPAADGTFTTSFAVTDPATTGFEIAELSAPGAIVRVGFRVTDGTAPAGQAVTAALGAGPLTMSQEGAGISFGTATLDGTARRLTGAINPVTVLDARGGHLGWTVTATMTDLVTADGPGRIPAGNISWTPTCVASAESPSAALPGSPGPLGATASTLCSQAAGAGGPTGGWFTAGADLTLTTPDFPAAGTYTGTLTLTLS